MVCNLSSVSYSILMGSQLSSRNSYQPESGSSSPSSGSCYSISCPPDLSPTRSRYAIIAAAGDQAMKIGPRRLRPSSKLLYHAARPLLLLGADAFAKVRPKPDALRILMAAENLLSLIGAGPKRDLIGTPRFGLRFRTNTSVRLGR